MTVVDGMVFGILAMYWCYAMHQGGTKSGFGEDLIFCFVFIYGKMIRERIKKKSTILVFDLETACKIEVHVQCEQQTTVNVSLTVTNTAGTIMCMYVIFIYLFVYDGNNFFM